MPYQFAPIGNKPGNSSDYARFLTRVFPEAKKFTPEFIEWQYYKNPNGEALGFDAFFDGQLIAHYVAIPVRYSINDSSVMGLLSLNTATDPQHQGKGLFTKLANKTYELAKEKNYQFVIGVANQNSTHGFLKKLGFYLIAQLDVKIVFGQINKRSNRKYILRPQWNRENINWRMDQPGSKYSLCGNGIFVNTDKLNIRAYMGDKQDEGELNIIREDNVGLLKVWIGIDNDRKFKGINLSLPERLKPSPLNLIFKDLNGNLPILQKEDVLFELIDFDAY